MYKIAIIGASSIGTGLAIRFATNDIKVELIDSPEKLDVAELKIKTGLKNNIDSGLMTVEQVQSIVEKINLIESISDISRDLDFVIEFISGSDLDRIKLFKKIDAILDDKTILVTTSLSLNLLALTQSTSRPDKIVCMQFFCPSESCNYAEFASSKYTTDFTLNNINNLCRYLNLIVIKVRNLPGFCLNRLSVPLLNEAVRLLEIGAADIYTINYAAKDTFKSNKGPFDILNEVGTDLIYKKCKELFDCIGEFYRPTNLLKATAESGGTWKLPDTVQEKDSIIISEDEYLEIKKHFKSLVFKLVSILAKENITSLNNINLSAKIGLGWKIGPVESMNELNPSIVNSYMDEISIIYPALSDGNVYTDSMDWKVASSSLNINGNIANISLNRPDIDNILTENLLREIYFDLDRVETDKNIDLITISGSINAFSKGEDLDYIHQLLCERDFEELNNYINRGKKLFEKIKSLKKPVIAILEGKVSGAGLSLALACDYIFATKSATLSFPEVNSGMIPLFGGITFLLDRLDYLLAKYLLITGVELSANQALEIGLIDNVFANWDVLNTEVLQCASNIDYINNIVLKPSFEGKTAEDILRKAKLLKNVDLIKQKKLISRRAKELMQIIGDKSSDAVYTIDHLVERLKNFDIDKRLEYELAKTQSYLQYTDILFFLSNKVSEKEKKELINI